MQGGGATSNQIKISSSEPAAAAEPRPKSLAGRAGRDTEQRGARTCCGEARAVSLGNTV
jgi:hypothetical protein